MSSQHACGRRNISLVRGLYPIVDVDSLRSLGSTASSVAQFAERVLEAQPPLLQLRAKHSGTGETLEQASRTAAAVQRGRDAARRQRSR